MGCLGGTLEDPRRWLRIKNGEVTEDVTGRVCTREEPYTTRRACTSCVAYRGRERNGLVATGLQPNDEPYALRPIEWERYQEALEATFDDDFSLLGAWITRMREGIGDRITARSGDPDALDRLAARAREWQAAHPGRQAEYSRRYAQTPWGKAARRAYMRDYMRKRRAAAKVGPLGNNHPPTREAGKVCEIE